MKDIIVFDIDGTLRDGTHRKHLVPTENLDRTESWNAFNLACGGDAPIKDNLDLMCWLAGVSDLKIVLLSSCCDVAYQVTYDWLASQGCIFDQLTMRQKDDHRPDVEFKEAKLREIGLDRILCCFEDNFRVAKHLRGLGLTVHVVRHYENPGVHEE